MVGVYTLPTAIFFPSPFYPFASLAFVPFGVSFTLFFYLFFGNGEKTVLGFVA